MTETCQTCGDPATQWDYDQLMYFCDRHVQQADFTVPLEKSEGRSLHPLEQIELKPRTTVKRFAADLKARIERAEACFDHPGQEQRVAGMRYVLGIVDAALSDYDVRDPGDMR
jgi:hypothetical protein